MNKLGIGFRDAFNLPRRGEAPRRVLDAKGGRHLGARWGWQKGHGSSLSRDVLSHTLGSHQPMYSGSRTTMQPNTGKHHAARRTDRLPGEPCERHSEA
jgi:hypothetical protein